jgi:hypothetical protein
MRRVTAALCTALALFACEAAEREAPPAAKEPAPAAQSAPSAQEIERQKLKQAAEAATDAAQEAAESAQAAGSAAEAAEELSGEAASLLSTLGFVDDRDVVQVLNARIGTRITFVPATIVVTAGSGRKLSIFNDTEAPHGFRIPGLALEVLLPPGQETLVELPPLGAPQIYAIDCHLHTPHRHATLVVLPAPASDD